MDQTPRQIFFRFLRFGLLAWGGPVAQIAMIKKELVEEEKWVSKEQFNRALAVYQVLPGPEAHELCVYFGMKAGGRLGGFLAGLAFMLPGFLLMLLFTWLYVQIRVAITNHTGAIRRHTGRCCCIDRIRRLQNRQTCRDQ